MPVVFPKRSVILLWLFLLLPLAALLLYIAYSFIFIRKYIIPYHLPRSWAQEISTTVTWNVTRLSENLARHVFLVPGESYDDLMVGS